MTTGLQLDVHGRGNAWPVPLGEEHPFYDRKEPRDLSNAAFSLVLSDHDKVVGDVLVDAGHGTIQSLVAGANRIPDSICLTHGHMDHTLSVDWVVQSFWRRHLKRKKYPIYATHQVYQFLIRSYPHLEELIELHELEFGVEVQPSVVMPFRLTPFPVYHGQGAVGASMLLFETPHRRVLFTGDLFSPLLRKRDYARLNGIDMLVVDTNNRFPWPRTNHWSFAGGPGDLLGRSDPLRKYLENLTWEQLMTPHRCTGGDGQIYFRELEAEWSVEDQPFTILEFLQKIEARNVMLVHYSGAEDQRYHSEPLQTSDELLRWATTAVSLAGISTEIVVPETGQLFELN